MSKTKLPDKITLDGSIENNINQIKLAGGDKQRTITIRCCDETIVDREFGKIQLSHDPVHVDLSKYNSGALFIKDHDSTKVDNALGKITNSYIKDGALFAEVRLSNRPEVQGVVDDILEGILTSVSVGTNITEVLSEDEIEVDGGMESVYKLAHQPYEVSLVVSPAIATARVILTDKEADNLIEALGSLQTKETVTNDQNDQIKLNTTGDKNMTDKVEMNQEEVLLAERNRVADIMKLSGIHGVDANEALAGGKSVVEFQGEVLKALETKATVEAPAKVGLTDKEAGSFSFLKSIQAAASGNWEGAEFEREVTQESARLAGKPVSANSFIVPADVSFASDSTTGNNVIDPSKRGTFIEAVYAKTLLDRMGVTMDSGLVGDVDYEVEGDSTVNLTWVGEDGDGAQGDVTSSLVSMSPKTAIALSSISHKMMMQSSSSIEARVRNTLLKKAALGVDQAILFNLVANANAPTSLLATAGLNAVDATAGLDYSKITEAYKLIANADLEGDLKWMTNPIVIDLLQNTLRSGADTASNYLLNNVGDKLNGFDTVVSSASAASKLILGDWGRLIVGSWSQPEVAIDPYTSFANGSINARIMLDINSVVTKPSAFSVITTA